MYMQRFALYAVCFLFYVFSTIACKAQPLHQKKVFTRQDTLRGSITPERAWWDVVCYKIAFNVDYANKYIEGKTEIDFKVSKPGKRMQIDLQKPMKITRAHRNNLNLPFTREGNVYYIEFPSLLKKDSVYKLVLVSHGNPTVAVTPPWDGGWIFSKDNMSRPWMSVACQGLGASVWFPCKDHQSDEPDSAFINIAVPDTLMAVANGKFLGKQSFSSGMMTYRWAVRNPINNYNIVPYIGKYVNWTETLNGEKGNLDCSYWVLDYNLEKAKEQFKQVPKMLKCFENWFGPFPFYEDGYKLVEAPHLGMEHQSAIAYGNKFQNGYLGRDLSGTGWGDKWDFIIIHESGHEWFANNITTNDIADMWVHESFTAYSETIFTECEYGKEAANDYVIGTRKRIQNDIPVIGPYGVNQEGSGDMYYKGSNMIHTIRQIINDDEKFRQILRGLNKEFYHKTVTTKQVEEYISKQSGIDFTKTFHQYLRTTQIPMLEYKLSGDQLSYRWTNCIAGFEMPVKIWQNDTDYTITPSTAWKTKNLETKNVEEIKADRNYYVKVKKVN